MIDPGGLQAEGSSDWVAREDRASYSDQARRLAEKVRLVVGVPGPPMAPGRQFPSAKRRSTSPRCLSIGRKARLLRVAPRFHRQECSR